MEKLNYDDALMLENIVSTINELIEEVEYLGKRIDRHWKYHRRILKDKEKPEPKGKKEMRRCGSDS